MPLKGCLSSPKFVAKMCLFHAGMSNIPLSGCGLQIFKHFSIKSLENRQVQEQIASNRAKEMRVCTKSTLALPPNWASFDTV